MSAKFVIGGILREEDVAQFADLGLISELKSLLTISIAEEIEEYLKGDCDPTARKIIDSELHEYVFKILYGRDLLRNQVPILLSSLSVYSLADTFAMNANDPEFIDTITKLQDMVNDKTYLAALRFHGSKESCKRFLDMAKALESVNPTAYALIKANKSRLWDKRFDSQKAPLSILTYKLSDIEMLVKGYKYLQTVKNSEEVSLIYAGSSSI